MIKLKKNTPTEQKAQKRPQTPLRDGQVEIKGSLLSGKRIALAICGGIGATESVKIARELRRQQAEVQAFMSPEAKKFITPLSVEWATQIQPVQKVGPQVEYLETFDLVLVCPATLHTLSKACLALSDTVVDLVIASALGSNTPVFMVPTMNEALWKNPILQEHLRNLKKWGVRIFPVTEDEGRLKVPESSLLVSWLAKELKKR